MTYQAITRRTVRTAWLALIASITAPTTNKMTMKETTMLDNIRWRLGMWAHHLIERWQWRWRISRPPERFTPRFKNLDGQDD